MKYDAPEIIASDELWGRRRANLRHEVSVPAVIIDRRGIAIECGIINASANGMALSLVLKSLKAEPGRPPLPRGSEATLEFVPDPVAAPDTRLTVKVNVVWRTLQTAGVRFLDLTPDLRAGLEAIVRTAVDGRIDAIKRARALTAEQRRVMQACRRTVQRLLPNIIWVLRTEVVKRLRLAAECTERVDARASLAAAERIEDKAFAIGRTIEHQFLHGFSEASDLDETLELTTTQVKAFGPAATSPSTDLDVVAEPAVQNSTQIAAIGHTLEERHKSKFFELSVRLANVRGRPLDAGTNPLAPGTACRIMWQALLAVDASAPVQQALQQVMVKHMVLLLGELYEAVHTTLDQEGVQRYFDGSDTATQLPRVRG